MWIAFVYVPAYLAVATPMCDRGRRVRSGDHHHHHQGHHITVSTSTSASTTYQGAVKATCEGKGWDQPAFRTHKDAYELLQ